jgi:hypothetical protein
MGFIHHLLFDRPQDGLPSLQHTDINYWERNLSTNDAGSGKENKEYFTCGRRHRGCSRILLLLVVSIGDSGY